MNNFLELGIKEDLVKGLDEMGIKIPSGIQQKVIPFLLQSDTDFVGQAQTGTGKTAAFGLPLLQKINPNLKEVQGLVLCPTRELGQQVAKQLFKYTKYTDRIFIESVYGGANIEKQKHNLSRPTHIIVATPGRLIDLVKQNAVNLDSVRTVILDEADEMLSMGFKRELDTILETLESVKSKWLFSATLPDGIRQIINRHLSKDAGRIELSKKNTVNKNIEHQYLICEEKEKLKLLVQILNSQKEERGVIFCRTKAATQDLADALTAKGISIAAIHGDMLQKDREKAMRAFKNGNLRLLVSTDIAARGIDVQGLSFVIHFQLPGKKEYYTHRAGRTARAGSKGISLCLVTTVEMKQIRFFEKNLSISFKQVRMGRN